jgi:hypothetical protein
VTDDKVIASEPACACAASRRELLKAAVGAAVIGLASGHAPAQTAEPRNARPQTGDRLVYSSGPKKGAVVAPADVPLGGRMSARTRSTRRPASSATARA